MITLFCYACKTHVEISNLEEFHRHGHVHTAADALSKYLIKTNDLPKDLRERREIKRRRRHSSSHDNVMRAKEGRSK